MAFIISLIYNIYKITYIYASVFTQWIAAKEDENNVNCF